MSLQISYTSEASSQKSTILLYGANGSGKTTFAATWPNPVFLVPWISRNEMKSLASSSFPVVYFKDLKELKAQVNALGKAVLDGSLKCDTIIVDNLTAIQTALEEELKSASGKSKLEWEEWGRFASVFTSLLDSLHKLPPHVIWITHQKVVSVGQDSYSGEFTLTGKSKELIPGFADMILHSTVTDLKAAGLKYRLYLKSHDIWPCRIRGSKDVVGAFPAYLEDPNYDSLATLMGWKSCAELEGTATPPEVLAAVEASAAAMKRDDAYETAVVELDKMGVEESAKRVKAAAKKLAK